MKLDKRLLWLAPIAFFIVCGIGGMTDALGDIFIHPGPMYLWQSFGIFSFTAAIFGFIAMTSRQRLFINIAKSMMILTMAFDFILCSFWEADFFDAIWIGGLDTMVVLAVWGMD
jgi:hypothetical protein